MNGMSNTNAKITTNRKAIPHFVGFVLILTQYGENT